MIYPNYFWTWLIPEKTLLFQFGFPTPGQFIAFLRKLTALSGQLPPPKVGPFYPICPGPVPRRRNYPPWGAWGMGDWWSAKAGFHHPLAADIGGCANRAQWLPKISSLGSRHKNYLGIGNILMISHTVAWLLITFCSHAQ